MCNRQNEAYRKANPDAGGSRIVVESWLAFDRDLREYNAANGITDGFTLVMPNPRKKAELRN